MFLFNRYLSIDIFSKAFFILSERYPHELDGAKDSSPHRLAALRFYQQAILLRPQFGQPFNQLGTLEGASLYSLRSLYYFLRCLLSPEPFVGVASNLKATFDKNRVSLQKARSAAQSSEKNHEELHVRSFIVIIESFWNEETPDRSTVSTLVEALKAENFQSGVLFYCVLVLLVVDERMRNIHKVSCWPPVLDQSSFQANSKSHRSVVPLFSQNEAHTNSNTVMHLMTVIGTRMILEVYHNLCMKTCLEHPFSNESSSGATKSENAAPATNRSMSTQRLKAKYRRRRKAFGDSSDEENNDEDFISFAGSKPNASPKQVSRRRNKPGSDGSGTRM